MSEPCRYCGGDCPSNENESCDGYQGDIDGLYANKEDDTPTYAEWMERYEAELESGQTRITRDEAERRFYKQNPDD